jgi:vanillate O-demethylase monooxygenase subunit
VQVFIGDAWYMAAWADELSSNPFPRRICNQPIVLYRSSDGEAAALYDSCCHRGAPLSVGSVIDEGLQCGYHGLVFGNDGVCVHIPGQQQIPGKARVRSYPVKEKDQMIWIWMGDPEKADPALIIDYPFHDDTANWPHSHGVYDIECNYLMLMDNLMDLTHLGYVHAKNVGGKASTLVEAEMDVTPTDKGVDVKRWMPDCEPPPTYLKCVELPEKIERWQEMEFIAPAAVLQWTGAVGKGKGAREDFSKRVGGFSMRLYHFATPVSETSCYYFWSAAHNHNVDDPNATQALRAEVEIALAEDKWIVSEQQNRVNETGADWRMDIRSDKARVAMRHAVKRRLKSSGPVASGPVV